MNLFLNLCAFGAIISAILTITSFNPINSIIGLITVYIYIAIYLIILSFNFIGLSYLIIYVGAIAILFLFVVMMMNIKYIELNELSYEYTQNLPLGSIIGILFILELLSSALMPLNDNNFLSFSIFPQAFSFGELNLQDQGGLLNELNPIKRGLIESENSFKPDSIFVLFSGYEIWDSIFYSLDHVEGLGHTLYTYGLLWFIIGSIILLLAMISPIILCYNDKKNSPHLWGVN